MARKKSKGRQKIEMVKIEKDSSLQAAFSKRRCSLIKKANDLSTLTGAEVAFIIFSPGNKAFSFGAPSVESVLERFKFQTPKPQPSNQIERLHQIYRQTNLEKLNQRIKLLQDDFEAEKTRGAMLDQMMELDENKYLWEDYVDDVSLDQLEKLKAAFLDIHDRARGQFGNLANQEPQRDPFSELWTNGLGHGHIPEKPNGPSGFQFSWVASSSSTSGDIDLNLPAAMDYSGFVLPNSATFQSYGLRF